MAVPLWVFNEKSRVVKRQHKRLEQLTDLEIQKNFGIPWWGVEVFIDFYEPLEGQRSLLIPITQRCCCF